MHAYNQSLSGIMMPTRIKHLPISPTGYPVPWFVTWFKGGQPCDAGEGEPDFRVADTEKMVRAIKHHLCWTCGGPMGVNKAFVIGPMCAITKTISEPPSHRDCAIFSAIACPFLSKPRMKRNEKDLPPQGVEPAGIVLKRNPGAVCVWITKSFRVFRAHAGNAGVLFRLGDPVETLWFAEGRPASRGEVLASIDSGYPALIEMAEKEGPAALQDLEYRRAVSLNLLPVG